MERAHRPKPKVGYFGSGLAAYWPQFPKLKPAVLATMERHAAKLEGMGCEVVRGGLVDRAELSGPVGDLFARVRQFYRPRWRSALKTFFANDERDTGNVDKTGSANKVLDVLTYLPGLFAIILTTLMRDVLLSPYLVILGAALT